MMRHFAADATQTMSQIIDGKFQCDACARSFAWKPELAGKRAKCKCGQTIVVPQAEQEPEPADDLYDFAESSAPPPPKAMVAPPVVSQPTNPIAYRSAPTADDRRRDRFSADNMMHAPRDVYVPSALLIIAFVGLIVWTSVSLGGGPVMVAIISAIFSVITVIKMIVLIGLAMLIAPHFGISFGTFWTGVLKFAAIILITDIALLWVNEWIESVGGMPSGRRGRGRIILIQLVLTAAIISALSRYLFDMDNEETGMFALPFAFVSWLCGLVVSIVLAAVIRSMLAPAPAVAPTPAAPTPAVTPAATSSTGARPAPRPPSIEIRESQRDREIADRIKSEKVLINEGREYEERHGRDKTDLVSRFLEAGAKRVYMETSIARRLSLSKAYVELPAEIERREACIKAYDTYCRDNQIKPDRASMKDDGQRFLVLDLSESKNHSRR